MKIGIEKISFHIPRQYLELSRLAEQHGTDLQKFSRGIGQERMSFPLHDEDVVTLAAEAALPIIKGHGPDGIDSVLFATETSIDQSKSAGIYVHNLLGLNAQCRNVELKQACYSATAAVQMACGYVARQPDRKVLVIASDVSRYDLGGAAEATQGCGAVAMLISANPLIMQIDVMSGLHSEDIMDFWRPNYRITPLVDGKYSALKYLQSLSHTWQDYQSNEGRSFEDFAQFCYHLPFSRMGKKAHMYLASINDQPVNMEKFMPGLVYNRVIGNCYSAALYLSLISALENSEEDLSGKPVALFSYGSGAVAEFFSGVVQPGYKAHMLTERHKSLIMDREALSYERYLELWHAPNPQNGVEIVNIAETQGTFRLAKIADHKRYYETVRS